MAASRDSDAAALQQRVVQLERALRLCVGVLSGETLNKSSLITALEASRDALQPIRNIQLPDGSWRR